MKKVIVPLCVTTLGENQQVLVHLARETYIHKLVKYGLFPVFVSTEFTRKMIFDVYQECTGLLIMDGNDYNPKIYNQLPHPTTKPGYDKLDLLEQELLEMAFEDKKPILGICRGCQAIAISRQGSLIQNIPDLNIIENHNVSNSSYDNLSKDPGHKVILERGSRIAKILNKYEINVTTGHHQSIEDPGNGIKVSGSSQAGIVEVIESIEENHFCFGVQSHPEALMESDLEPLFKEFAKSVDIFF